MGLFRKILLTVIVVATSIPSCIQAQQTDAEYLESVEKWHRHREAELKKEDGWLSVAGLFWLEEGSNTCPLPTEANVLPVAILAGEKDYHLHP
jgi:uncharacterized protein (DUF1684 family)